MSATGCLGAQNRLTPRRIRRALGPKPKRHNFRRSREAKKLLVGKTSRGPSCQQQDINQLMVGLAKSGRRVVRLKGGDPMIFGRAGEEIAACRKARVAVEVVPGVTAAQGAAGRLGVSLTHRSEARRVQYLMGHAADGALSADIDWRSVADPAVTTIVYMPLGTLHERHRRGPGSGDAGGCCGAGHPARRMQPRFDHRRTAGPGCRGQPAGSGDRHGWAHLRQSGYRKG